LLLFKGLSFETYDNNRKQPKTTKEREEITKGNVFDITPTFLSIKTEVLKEEKLYSKCSGEMII